MNGRTIMTGKRALLLLTLVSAVLSLAVPAQAGTKEVPPSDACVESFLKAMAAGDAAALGALVTGDEEQRAWVVAYSRQLAAFHKLTAALTKRFGDLSQGEEGKALSDRVNQSADEELYDDLKRAKRQVHADRVLLVVNEGQPDDLQPRLVMKEGKWKVDLASLSEYMSPSDTPMYRAVAEAADGLTRELKEGKLASIQEATEAVENRLSAAEERAQTPKH
jgi:hypothetical protein